MLHVALADRLLTADDEFVPDRPILCVAKMTVFGSSPSENDLRGSLTARSGTSDSLPELELELFAAVVSFLTLLELVETSPFLLRIVGSF